MLRPLLPAAALLWALASPAMAFGYVGSDDTAGLPFSVIGALICLTAAFVALTRAPGAVKVTLSAVGFLVVTVGAAFADSDCDGHFLGGVRPAIVSPEAKFSPDANTVLLCNDGYALLYDREHLILVYSAEHITTASLDEGADVERANSFKADPRLKPEESAHPDDYVGSGYDKGHMSPDHDMPTVEAKRQSDYLDNVIPQNAVLNRGLWSQIEARGVRGSIIGGLDGYVATGPIMTPAPKQRAAHSLKGRIPVPPRIFKAFYRPADTKGRSFVGAWVARNEADAQLEVWSLDKLTQEIGHDVFPSLSAEDHARADLPAVAAK